MSVKWGNLESVGADACAVKKFYNVVRIFI